MELIIEFYKNNKVIDTLSLDGRPFYNLIYVFKAYELKLIDIEDKYLLSTRESYKLRLNLTINDNIKKMVYNLSDDNFKLLLDICNSNYYKITINDFINIIKEYTYGNIEDILDYLSSNKNIVKESEYIIIKKG